MRFESLKGKKKVTAYIKPLKTRIKCKVEEFDAMKANDENGKIEKIGVKYKLYGYLKDLEVIFYINNQEDVDSFELQM